MVAAKRGMFGNNTETTRIREERARRHLPEDPLAGRGAWDPPLSLPRATAPDQQA